MRSVLLLLIPSVCIATGCTVQTTTLATSDASESLTDQQAEDFGVKLEKLVLTNDVNAANALFNWDELFRKSTDVAGASLRLKQGFIKGLHQSIPGRDGVLSQICEVVVEGGRYDFLRVDTKDGMKRAFFRLCMPDSGGVNYHIVEIAPDESGNARGNDIYIMLTGEKLSDTVRRSFLSAVANQGIMDRLTGKENEFLKNLEPLSQMTKAVRDKRPETVLRIYKGLPKSLRADKNCLMMRYRAAQLLSDEELVAAIDDFRSYHPDDPCGHFIAIDVFAVREQFDKAFAAIDRVESTVGPDAYLDHLRSNFHYMKKDYEKAKEFARKAIDKDTDLIDPYWTLTTISLEQKDAAGTLELLTRLQNEFGVEFGDLTQHVEYADFVKSKEFQMWKREIWKG